MSRPPGGNCLQFLPVGLDHPQWSWPGFTSEAHSDYGRGRAHSACYETEKNRFYMLYDQGGIIYTHPTALEINMYLVLVCSGCYNKIPHTEWLKQ